MDDDEMEALLPLPLLLDDATDEAEVKIAVAVACPPVCRKSRCWRCGRRRRISVVADGTSIRSTKPHAVPGRNSKRRSAAADICESIHSQCWR